MCPFRGLNRRFAFFAGDFADKFWYKVTGEPGSDFGNEFAGAFIAHFEVCDTVGVVQLVKVVGENPLRKELSAEII